MNTTPMDVVSLAHAAKNKRTRNEAELEGFDDEDMTEQELQEEDLPPIQLPELPTPDEERKRRVLCSQLKNYKIKYPNIDTRKSEAIDRELALLPTEELEKRLENVKVEIGIANPNHNAKSALGLVGFFLEYYLGLIGITPNLVADEELVACIDSYLPESFHWLGVPFLFCFRLGSHVSNYINGVHSRSQSRSQATLIPAQQQPAIANPNPQQPILPNVPNTPSTNQQQLQQPPTIGGPPPPTTQQQPTHHPTNGATSHGGATNPPSQGSTNSGRAVPIVQPS